MSQCVWIVQWPASTNGVSFLRPRFVSMDLGRRPLLRLAGGQWNASIFAIRPNPRAPRAMRTVRAQQFKMDSIIFACIFCANKRAGFVPTLTSLSEAASLRSQTQHSFQRIHRAIPKKDCQTVQTALWLHVESCSVARVCRADGEFALN